jgi:hypothetical protein
MLLDLVDLAVDLFFGFILLLVIVVTVYLLR